MFSESTQKTGVGLVLTIKEDGIANPLLPPTDPKDDAYKLEGVRRSCPSNSKILGKPVTKGGKVLDHKHGILGGAVDASSAEIAQNPFSLGQELAREVSEEMIYLIERMVSLLTVDELVTFIFWYTQLLNTLNAIPNSNFHSFTGIRVGQFLENPQTGQQTLRGVFEVRAVEQVVPPKIGRILKKVGFEVPTNKNQIRPYVRAVLEQLGYITQ